MASTRLTRSITGSNSYKATFSAWLKLSGNADKAIFTSIPDGSNNFRIHITGTNQLQLKDYQSSSTVALLLTTQVFRDPGAFYHIVVSIDTSLGTADDRAKIYVNGTQVTSFASRTNYPVNNVPVINKTGTHEIGAVASGDYFDGLMSYMAVVDGTTYDATSFGETNAATGIWKIKTSPSVTYGTNGFFLKMDTSSPGSDTSGNNNTFTASGTPTLAEDNCSNNLVTMNPLDNYRAASTFSNGNNTIVSNASNNTYNTSTIGVASGKFYSEVKVNTNNDNVVGIAGGFSGSSTAKLEDGANNYGYVGFDGTVMNNGSTLATYGTYTTGDIIGIAVDCTNNKFYVSKNGVFQGSADPSNNTGGLSITAAASVINNVYMFAGGENSGARTVTHNWNFGNGFFGVTAVASSNADAAGHGLFEYAVPTGFYTLNTKNLNTYGG